MIPGFAFGALGLVGFAIGFGQEPDASSSLGSTPSGADDTPEPNNQYLSKKDLKVIALGLVIVFPFLWLFWLVLKGNSDQYQCFQNLKAMSTAFGSYQSSYDDRLPPTYLRQSDSSLPQLDSAGKPFTWASTLVNLAGFDRKHSFLCPSAPSDSKIVAEGLDGSPLPMSYGMYAGLDVAPIRDIDDPGYAVLVTETDNGGDEDTFDPHPMVVNGKTLDSFVIGWETGDDTPPANPKQYAKVTRLAFKHSKKGLNGSLDQGRHNIHIDVLFADGHAEALKSSQLSDPKHWPLVAKP